MRTLGRKKNSGFTLVELLIALSLGGVLVSAIYGLFILQNKSYVAQNNVADMQQNARIAMSIMSGDFRMAGFGFSMNGDYSRAGGNTYAVTPTNSSNTPDSVTIRYGVDPTPNVPVTLTNAMANSTVTSMVVSNTAGFQVNGYIILSDGQNASQRQVTAVNNSTTLTLASVSPNIFPTGGFSAGTRIFNLRQVSYRVSNNVLQNQTDGVTWVDMVNNIEDLQLAYQGSTTPAGTWVDNPSPVDQTTVNAVQINLLSRSNDIDSNVTGLRPLLRDHAVGSSDHFRRKLLTSTVRIRNL
jgi:type IV pilus assembly protein PilW